MHQNNNLNMWKDLSMADKAKFINVAVNNNITDLASIEKAYNSFAEGGDTTLPNSTIPNDFNSQINHAIDFGKWANSDTGKKILPVVEYVRQAQLEAQLHPERYASAMSLLGGAIGMIPTPFTWGLGALMQIPDLIYDTRDYLSNRDMSSASSLAADGAGYLPYVGAQAISTLDDYLGTKGTNIYDYITNAGKKFGPWDYWRYGLPYKLPEVTVTPTKNKKHSK